MRIGRRAGNSVVQDELADTLTLESHFQEVLNSPSLLRAQSQRSLLLYLWQHRGDPVSEYALAVDVFGKKADFESKIDASVRVQVSRLRLRLKEFYDTDGASSPVRLSIPVGKHELRIQSKPAAAKIAEANPTLWPLVVVLAGTSILFAALWAGAYSENRKSGGRHPASGTAEVLPALWRRFFANGKPASLFLPTPVFFEFAGQNLKVRDPVVNDFGDLRKSPELSLLAEKWGEPKLLQTYTVASDTFGALGLAQYLETRGIRISIAGTADLSIDSVGDQNVILIGVPGTSRQLDELLTRTNFQPLSGSTGNTGTIVNSHPLPGERAQFQPLAESNIRRTAPGLVSILPGKLPGTRLLLITGSHTYALVHSLVTEPLERAVEGVWQQAASPDFFEMVLNGEIEGQGTVLRMWPEAIHKVNINDWK